MFGSVAPDPERTYSEKYFTAVLYIVTFDLLMYIVYKHCDIVAPPRILGQFVRIQCPVIAFVYIHWHVVRVKIVIKMNTVYRVIPDNFHNSCRYKISYFCGGWIKDEFMLFAVIAVQHQFRMPSGKVIGSKSLQILMFSEFGSAGHPVWIEPCVKLQIVPVSLIDHKAQRVKIAFTR